MNAFFNFLVASPSSLEGAARILDFGNTLTEFNTTRCAQQADSIAIQSDWYFVGQDLWFAVRKLKHQLAQEKQREQLVA